MAVQHYFSMKKKKVKTRDKSLSDHGEAWILGSGTGSLASAFYLTQYAKMPPNKVHLLESRDSIREVLHQTGDSNSGYDQFAACLPLPGGGPLRDILASIPSSIQTDPGHLQSSLRMIQSAEVQRAFAKQGHCTRMLVQKSRMLRLIAAGPFDLQVKHRLDLIRLVLGREKRLGRNHIKDFFSESFFETAFWAVWSAQFGIQPWHSSSEFRRILRQYLDRFHDLSILSCLDITGYHQYASIFLPIFLYLRNLGVDFRFDTQVTDIVTTSGPDSQTVSRLDLIREGFPTHIDVREHDIVLATLGSTDSGTAVGSNDEQPVTSSFEAYQDLDENWSLWLTLSAKSKKFGNPYCFCSHRTQSMLESFTITTEDINFFNYLTSMSRCTPTTGAIIILQESPWKLSLCIPAQPVFHRQPDTVRVLWGFALFPEGIGASTKKPMLQCSGKEIMKELLQHLDYPSELLFQRTVTIPRVMPRMSSILLAHSVEERPEPIISQFSNLGLLGQFVEIPQYSCIDMSYSVRAAQMVVSRLTGVDIPSDKMKRSCLGMLLPILLWK